ncbi:universal stress protein [Nitrosomonas marina]|uniref:Nucleotide-binding universal stress protein, UspA family n=1 Tax=Nitrosomonas marina TaxID=917 RepID=A0A1H8IKB5_9PROT|nr:universal stress protein [Nitrosomonas marina]SEN68772.1 Nucleotide-binding universal stress protein, UspA family [Nitrosomonas marina]
MYKKIMVAIDGSETAQSALEEAENIANSYNAGLCIVHCITGEEAADKAAGQALLEKSEESVNALSIETRLLEANIAYGTNGISDAIGDAVKDWGADLLVVGTANRRGLERFVVGSVAEQLVSLVESSILLVRPQN